MPYHIPKGDACGYARGDARGGAEHVLDADKDVEPERQPEGQQRQIGDCRRDAVEGAAILAALDNAVIEARRDHQRDRNRHQDQRQGLDMLRMPWQFIEAFAERRAQLEAEKDLRPEDQHPGFVERGLDLFRQLHF